jgi:hypothetical protein
MLSVRSVLSVLIVVTGTLAITACGTIHVSGTSGHQSGTAGTESGATSAGTSAAMVEAYTVPNANPRADGSVYAQLVTNGALSGRSSFGTGTDVWQVHPTSPQSVNCACLIAYQSDLQRSEFIQLPTLTKAGWQVALPGTAQDHTALQSGSALLSQSGASVAQATLSAISATGTSQPQVVTPTHTYQLPVISPDPVAGVLPRGYKGLATDISPGQVSAMIQVPGGDIVALASTGRGAAITDLSSGKSRPLAGYGQLGAAALAPDGQIYALAWRDFDPSFTIKVLRISPSTLAVTRTYDTGVVPGEYRNSVVLPAGSSNAILGLFYGDEHGITAKLWTVAGTSMRSMATLPLNIALDASVIGNDLYLFGGPAKNHVSRLTISTGTLTRDVPSLRTPANSWVLAVSAA